MNDEYKLSPNVKWIVVGGSYAGSIAALGALSASGPILAKLNWEECYVKIYEDYQESFGTECLIQIEKAFKQVDEMLQKPEKHDELNKIFNLCHPIQDSLKNNISIDITNLFDLLIHMIGEAAQGSYYNDGTNPLGSRICQGLSNTQLGNDEVHRLAALALKLMTQGECLEHRFAQQFDRYKNVTFNVNEYVGVRQWTYQTCTEFGFLQTTDHKPQIFGKAGTLEKRLRMCTDLFGDGFNASVVGNAIDRTNAIYGGLNLNATNIVSVHGSKDPWSELGLKRALNPASPAIVIEGWLR